ncbi:MULTISPECIES: DUF3173 family protein [unclassified Enterococcus]|uniref:DUF3173 family protein n=1 Tax=unclassified Enterococcus TaxID=2608891 RepID=UPI001CE163C7|nr:MULTISPECIES: DUF3173 family protein [unclassified Enterococcus]MCA5014047.1 DUF3173 family protein [Enterococcus sp. S23]MCA5017179.1 DUF3173 family protein [Enterococcus sp. S22(2020)]
MITVAKEDVVKLGFKPYQSERIIREAKALLVERGCLFYQGSKVRRVPKNIVEEMLNAKFEEGVEDGENAKCI